MLNFTTMQVLMDENAQNELYHMARRRVVVSVIHHHLGIPHTGELTPEHYDRIISRIAECRVAGNDREAVYWAVFMAKCRYNPAASPVLENTPC